MADAKEKLRCDVETVQAFARDNMHDMTCADYVAMKQVCAALSDVLNAPSTPPADAALADDAIIELVTDYAQSKVRAESCRYHYESKEYDKEAADTLEQIRAALRAELTEARRQLKEASEQGPAFDAAERPLRYGNGEGEPIKVRAYLHPTHDGLVTTDETAYTKPRELVLHDDVADRIDWLEKGIAEWRAVAMYAQEKLRSAKDAG